MRYIPLLFVLLTIGTVGCATSTNDLYREAMGCGKELVIEPNGIVRKPTEQEKADQCAPAWQEYNDRVDAQIKREESRRLDSQCCMDGHGRRDPFCKCISGKQLEELLRRGGY